MVVALAGNILSDRTKMNIKARVSFYPLAIDCLAIG